MQQYLVCRHFELITDHKPLKSLFNECKRINPQASVRNQRWTEKLAANDDYFSIRYRPGSENFCAGALNGLLLPVNTGNVTAPGVIFMVMSMFDCNNGPITSKQIYL